MGLLISDIILNVLDSQFSLFFNTGIIKLLAVFIGPTIYGYIYMYIIYVIYSKVFIFTSFEGVFVTHGILAPGVSGRGSPTAISRIASEKDCRQCRQRLYELRLQNGASVFVRRRDGSEPFLSKPSRPLFKFDTLKSIVLCKRNAHSHHM